MNLTNLLYSISTRVARHVTWKVFKLLGKWKVARSLWYALRGYARATTLKVLKVCDRLPHACSILVRQRERTMQRFGISKSNFRLLSVVGLRTKSFGV